MTCYVIVDTNVLVSALLSRDENAATVRLLDRLIAGEMTPVYSASILAEYREVLFRKKFRFRPEVVNTLLEAVAELGVRVEPPPSDTVLPDKKDLPFYEAALGERGRNAYLVTGNLRHFPQLSFILSPRQMLDILDSRDRETGGELYPEEEPGYAGKEPLR